MFYWRKNKISTPEIFSCYMDATYRSLFEVLYSKNQMNRVVDEQTSNSASVFEAMDNNTSLPTITTDRNCSVSFHDDRITQVFLVFTG